MCYVWNDKQTRELITSWLKKKWPKKWGGHGCPGRCSSVALDTLVLGNTNYQVFRLVIYIKYWNWFVNSILDIAKVLGIGIEIKNMVSPSTTVHTLYHIILKPV